MKNILSILAFLIVFSKSATSQNFWAFSAGSVKEDEVLDICYDHTGNIISTGYFSGSISFGNGSVLNSNSIGIADIYISKSSSSGQTVWATKAGGMGSDRATSVISDQQGNIYVTGFFYGIANFGTITLTSANGSQDGFIAKLDQNGNYVWAKSFGGNLAEWGNSIAIDYSGNPIITGQFQGTSNFDGTLVTSIQNPNTAHPSFDIFTAKYSSSGNLKWIQKGASKFDDRGIEVITDKFDNVYVCGQFSDTIQFQNTHNNYIMNATFIIKYDSIGQEKWFRKAAGMFSIPNSMVMDAVENIYITGDFQGTLTYFDSNPYFLSGTFSKRTYLLKIDNDGNYIWGKSESSNNYISSKKVAVDSQQNPYIFGEFSCTLNEYSGVASSTSFNSIGFQDFFITKYNNSGIRQWYKHYGGARNDKAHGLLLAGINEPIMAGSYEHALNMPSTNNNITIINNTSNNHYSGPNQSPTYCSATGNYNQYTHLNCRGYSDAFIFKGFDLTRAYYDYYERAGSLCNINFVGSCINKLNSLSACSDTIQICRQDTIFADTKTGYDGYIGPLHDFVWNNSSIDTLQKLFKNSSGYNTIKVTTIDGCYSSEDTVYVKVNPLPQPATITDNIGINIMHPKPALPFAICGPGNVTLTGGNIHNNAIQWIGSTLSTMDSSAILNTTGTYSIVLTTPYGCKDTNYVHVSVDSPLPTFLPFQKDDTVTICSGHFNVQHIYDSISNPLGNINHICTPYTNLMVVSASSGLLIKPIVLPSYCELDIGLQAPATGNYTYTIGYILKNACTTDTIFYNGNVHMIVNQSPSALLSINANTLICPGDSTLIIAGLSNFNSSNITYTFTPEDSVITSTPDLYWFEVTFTDTTSGCSEWLRDTIRIRNKPNPFIISNPYNSIICSNDSVRLTINLPNALTYDWYGPSGQIAGNSQTIYTKLAGFYHCIVTDVTGCIFITNTTEVKNYSTPFLLNLTSAPICNNQPTTIQVITLDTTLIVWNAPLSGISSTQIVSNPGVYSCEVSMCGITSSLSINILGSTSSASITANGPTSVCPFDSVTLSGNSGMVNYLWLPGNYTGQNYTVHSADSYTLFTTDIFGCTSSSSPASVTFTTAISSPIIQSNDTICFGQSITLSATTNGGNQIEWFTNNNVGPVLYTGNSFTTPSLTNTTTYYVASVSSSGCHSNAVPVNIFIQPSSITPILLADTLLCKNDTIKIITTSISNVNYNWMGPNLVSPVNNNELVILNATAANSGTYSLSISGSGCTSQTSTVFINVLSPQAPNIITSDTICENSNYILTINPIDLNNIYNWTGPNGFSNSGNSLTIVNALLNQSGTYTIVAQEQFCFSDPSLFNLTVLETPTTPIILGNTQFCKNDTINLHTTASSNYTYHWSGPNNFHSDSTGIFIIGSDSTNNGVYTLIAHNLICPSNVSSTLVHVFDYPVLFSTHDTIACEENELILNSSSNYSNYTWNTGETAATISVSQSGTYWVSSKNGICSTTDTIHVSLITCNQIVINVFTPNGDGANDLFMFKSPAIKEIHCEIRNRWGKKIGQFDGPENGWNGKSMITNEDCDEGVYFYTVEYKTIEGVSETMSGFVNLFR